MSALTEKVNYTPFIHIQTTVHDSQMQKDIQETIGNGNNRYFYVPGQILSTKGWSHYG